MSISKIVAFLTLVGILMGAMLLYANTAYFPNEKGVVLEQKVVSLQEQTNKKLDLILEKVEK